MTYMTYKIDYLSLNLIKRFMTRLKLNILLLFTLFANQLNAQSLSIDNIINRPHTSLNGKWSYLVDPYSTGYYDYR